MDTYALRITFPDLDTAKRDAGTLVERLRTAGLTAELADAGTLEGDDAGSLDPGQTDREVWVHAQSPQQAGERVREVVEGQFPAGMVLVGEPTRVSHPG